MGSLRVAVLALGCTSAAACHDDDGGLEASRGELGFAVFRWDCSDVEDAATCENIPFPTYVAVGATFRASFSLAHGVPHEVNPQRLEPASTRLISGDGFQFNVLGPGRVALLALGEDSVIDYARLEFLQTERLAIAATEDQPPCMTDDCGEVVFPGGAFALVPGRTVRVEARPFAGAAALAGDLPYTWSSDTPQLLGVTTEFDGDALLHPIAEGTAQIVVGGGGVTETISLVITAAPAPPSTDEGSGTASGSDDGSGSGSSSDSGSDSGSGSGTASDSGDGSTGATTDPTGTTTGTGGGT